MWHTCRYNDRTLLSPLHAHTDAARPTRRKESMARWIGQQYKVTGSLSAALFVAYAARRKALASAKFS